MTNEEMQVLLDMFDERLDKKLKPMQEDIKSMQKDIKSLDKKIDTQTQELKDYIYKNNVDIGVVFTEALEGTQDRVVEEISRSMEFKVVRKDTV